MVTRLAAIAAPGRHFATLKLSLGLSIGLLMIVGARVASAQSTASQPVHFRVEGESQRLEMIVNTSRILTLEHNVPRLLVNNPEVVKASPLSPNQIQISAVKPGVTQVNVWDDRQQVHSIDVVVLGDARELENLLKGEFPDAVLKIRPLSTSVVISGFVPNPEMVGRIVRMAEDYYQNVINNMTVGGVQQVNLHVKVMEVSRTKLRALGIDWANLNGDDFITSSVAGLAVPAAGPVGVGADTLRWGVLTQGNNFGMFIEALRRDNLVKIMAEPTLTTVSGRPAMFNAGGEIPIIVPQSLGTVSVEYREFGTRIDFVPIVLGNGNIRLEVRPQISELDPANSVNINNINVPGLRTRGCDTAVEMRAGQTLALAGLIQTRQESENRGLPVLADLPWVGAAFRRVENRNNEVELVILVTPEFCEALDPEEVPACGPGERTTNPDDCDFYGRGYLEVPKCCTDGSCSNCQQGGSAHGEVEGSVHGVGHEAVIHGSSQPQESFEYGQAPMDPQASSGPRRSSAKNRNQPVAQKGAPQRRKPSAAAGQRTPASYASAKKPAGAKGSGVAAREQETPRWMQPSGGSTRTAVRTIQERSAPERGAAQRSTPNDGGGEPGLIGPIGYEAIR